MSGTVELELLKKATTALRILWAVAFASFGLGVWVTREHFENQSRFARLETDYVNLAKQVNDHETWALVREEDLRRNGTKAEKMLQRLGDKLGVSWEGIE